MSRSDLNHSTTESSLLIFWYYSLDILFSKQTIDLFCISELFVQEHFVDYFIFL